MSAHGEPVGGTPWADSPVHPFVGPDAATVAAGEADADRCDECGEVEDHRKHHVGEPASSTRCPAGGDPAGCGFEFVAELDSEGFADCPECGLFFKPMPGMEQPYACDRCGTVYDEASGDGYCGLCPSCADATEPVIDSDGEEVSG